jgi:uncharacterized damage-inducible protein DinB
MLLTMAQYNWETNIRLLNLAKCITAAQWDAPQEAGQRSLHETLFHIVAVEEEWLHVCATGNSIWGSRSLADFPSVETLQELNTRNREQYRPWFATLREEQLAMRRVYAMPQGTDQEAPLWALLLHMLYHSAQHRSEVAFMLTRYGYSPGFIDFFGYGFSE